MTNDLKWRLPADLLAESVRIMQPCGAKGHEGLAMWLGVQHDLQVDITHVVALRGAGLRTAPLQIRLSYQAINRLSDIAEELGTYLVGQIHSHPGHHVGLSDVDRELGIRVQGYLSVVYPHYAQRSGYGLQACGVHAFEAGDYRRLPGAEVAARVETIAARVQRIDLEVAQ